MTAWMLACVLVYAQPAGGEDPLARVRAADALNNASRAFLKADYRLALRHYDEAAGYAPSVVDRAIAGDDLLRECWALCVLYDAACALDEERGRGLTGTMIQQQRVLWALRLLADRPAPRMRVQADRLLEEIDRRQQELLLPLRRQER